MRVSDVFVLYIYSDPGWSGSLCDMVDGMGYLRGIIRCSWLEFVSLKVSITFESGDSFCIVTTGDTPICFFIFSICLSISRR